MVIMEPAASPDCAEHAWQIECMSAPSTPALVRELRHQIMDCISTVCLSTEELEAVELAVGEACSNALKHGSPRGAQDEIRVRCMRDCSTLIVEISDNGCGFDPRGVRPPDPEEMRESGMGIMLMRRLMDEVEFEFGRGTTVRLVKHCRNTLADT